MIWPNLNVFFFFFYRNEKLSSILSVKNSSGTNSTAEAGTEDEPFQANLINSTVYIVSMTLQVSTFAVNYRVCRKKIGKNKTLTNIKYLNFQGLPFMESMLDNKFLLYSLVSSTAAIFALAGGIIPDIAANFEIVDFPTDVSTQFKL